ncbi:uncharacterized protein UTRI_04082 [Ustilago trichophora]|uniref:Uncharacterized protein n=1 Tax=Ustilago trichophora TaxID=86804 RepID=A0A5C3E706_9BASI|nr:uncharacterized protein UTRI_04082 [Ustilago trichophora]
MGLVGLATVLISSALVAASSSSNGPSTPVIDSAILVPCGPAGEKAHAVVPDANGCQTISSSGAFVVSQLPNLPDGIKIGFAADPDCSKTYTPTYEELASLRDGEQCTVYLMDTRKSTTGTLREGMGPGTGLTSVPVTDWNPVNGKHGGHGKRSIVAENPALAQPGEADDKESKWNKFVTKKKRDNNAGAPADNQIPLKYVMLVNA